MSNKYKYMNNKNKNTKQEDKTTKLIKDTLKTMNQSLNDNQIKLLVQIFKFIIVGGIATIIDWIIYYICYHFIGIEPLIANIISFTISVIYNFWASIKYVFDVKGNNKRNFIIFIVFAVIGLGLNEIIIFLLHNKLSWNAMLVKIIATAIVMVFNFVTRKKLLEK